MSNIPSNEPHVLTRSNLICEETGEVKLWVLRGLARREAMKTWGAITPRSLRFALREVADHIPLMQCAWRQRHGLPVATSTVTSFAPDRDGVRRSSF